MDGWNGKGLCGYGYVCVEVYLYLYLHLHLHLHLHLRHDNLYLSGYCYFDGEICICICNWTTNYVVSVSVWDARSIEDVGAVHCFSPGSIFHWEVLE